jgi:hypothetical protein
MATENNKLQKFDSYTKITNTVKNASNTEKTLLVTKSDTILGYLVSDLLS